MYRSEHKHVLEPIPRLLARANRQSLTGIRAGPNKSEALRKGGGNAASEAAGRTTIVVTIAAMLAACREHGATEARVLRHASSYETLADVHPQPPTNAVGYAGVIVG